MWINTYLLVYFSGIQEVKNLHHYESIEDKSKVSWVAVCIFEDVLIVRISIDKVDTTTTYCSSNDSIVPFVFWMASKYSAVKAIYVLGYKSLTCED